jgi:hypothetical protein
MNGKLFLIILGAFVLVVLLNILTYKLIVSRALKKIMKPYFNSLGYRIDKVEFPGLFSTGDFKNRGFQIRPVFKMGSPVNSTFVSLFLKPIENQREIIRITAKIETVFLFIRKVEYSKLLPNLIK